MRGNQLMNSFHSSQLRFSLSVFMCAVVLFGRIAPFSLLPFLSASRLRRLYFWERLGRVWARSGSRAAHAGRKGRVDFTLDPSALCLSCESGLSLCGKLKAQCAHCTLCEDDDGARVRFDPGGAPAAPAK
eukprot:scaffold462_cov195-Pinguiococcus_pyrenoidosus.AAC.51